MLQPAFKCVSCPLVHSAVILHQTSCEHLPCQNPCLHFEHTSSPQQITTETNHPAYTYTDESSTARTWPHPAGGLLFVSAMRHSLSSQKWPGEKQIQVNKLRCRLAAEHPRCRRPVNRHRGWAHHGVFTREAESGTGKSRRVETPWMIRATPCPSRCRVR